MVRGTGDGRREENHTWAISLPYAQLEAFFCPALFNG
jgi:hypothetical protein